jgi:hypothetical protein
MMGARAEQIDITLKSFDEWKQRPCISFLALTRLCVYNQTTIPAQDNQWH